MKVYKNFKEIIGKLEKNGLIEHSILVSNSSQEREEVYTNLRDLNLEEKRDILGMIGELSDTDKKSLIEEVLTSVNYNFIVTPKEVDFVIDKLSMIIGEGINKCLHDI